ncbi:exportin-T isoform X2 [Folsomia candida]|uniref:exportin-T isoform X2 n=1 Tax=Folsomia candida TaxID=158441 RepID=UPI000B901308|nr:exportin-T isoform X2 [Folsomia candida]
MDEGILLGLGNASGSFERHMKAINYFEQLKLSDTGWQLCVQYLSTTGKTVDSETQFFCLQVIENFVKTRYLASSTEHQNILKNFLFRWTGMQVVQPRAFLYNKVAQIIALIFIQDYPMRWPNFYDDLFSTMETGGEANINMYLRILYAIDTEIADRDIARTNVELQRNNLIKDAMREGVVERLADSWYRILTTFDSSKPDIVCQCLQVIGKYILWMDINLVANDRFVSVLVKNLSESEVQDAAADCIHDIICKGMDPLSKTKLVESFYTVLTNAQVWDSLKNGSPFLSSLGRIVNAMGCTVIDGYNKLAKTGDKQGEVCQYIFIAIENKVPLILEFLANEDDDASASILDYLKDYLHLLKQSPALTEQQNKYFQMTLEIITRKLQFDEDYNFMKERETEADFQEFRKQLKIIFENLAQINKMTVIEHVKNILNIAIHNWKMLPFHDSEVALLLMYYLGEAIPAAGVSLFTADLAKSSPIQVLLLLIMNSDIYLHTHQSVVLQYFEIIVRYEKFFVCHPDYIASVLASFLKETGLFHPDKRVRSRCSYLFCRFIKSVRCHITDQLTNDIIHAIQPLLALVTPSKFQGTEPLMSSDDQLYLYEVVGVVIISGDKGNEKGELMKKVVTPLLETSRRVTEELAAEKDPHRQEELANVVIQAISVTSRLSKAFSNQLTMKTYNCTSIFLDALQIFIQSVQVAPDTQQISLQSCVRQYLHRMVVCLEEELLPYIPLASQALLKNCDCKSIQEYMPLINQVITKFKKEVVPFLNQMFTPMVQSVFRALAEPIELNDQIATGERRMLQRQYYNFIATIVTSNVMEVLSAEENSAILHQVMLSVIQGSVEFPDPVAQRACFSIMKKFVEMWGGQDNPEGFIDFLYKNILPACFMAPLKPHFDISDAQTLLALNEIGNCLLVILEKRKDEFRVYLQTHYLPTLNIPVPKIVEFLEALQRSPKDFRLFLKSFFQQLKASLP